MTENGSKLNRINFRRLGLTLTSLGLALFLLGAKPGWFGLDRSEAVGFVQVGVFMLGLLLIALGGTFSLESLWPAGWKSIGADIGLRLVWTGFVAAMATGMADVFGLGTRPVTSGTPFFGFWQQRGVLLGQAVMLVGFLLMIPFKKPLPPKDIDAGGDAEGDKEDQPEITIQVD